MDLIAFENHCENYEFSAHGRVFLATIEDTPAALAAAREVLAELGVPEEDLSTESYLKRISRTRAS